VLEGEELPVVNGIEMLLETGAATELETPVLNGTE